MKQVVLLMPILALTACNSSEPKPEQTKSAEPAIRVQTIRVAHTEWPATYERTGTVQARTSTVISSRVMGYIREIPVSVGDRVRSGQVLAVLDSRDLDAQKRAAIAAREEARSSTAEIANSIASARANLDLAEATHRRMSDLFAKTSISNQEMDEATAKLRMARAAYEGAQSRRVQLDSKIAQAEEGVRAAEVMAGFTRIVAPFAGVVIDKPAQPGTLASPGAPLLTMEQQGAYRVEVPVEESRIASVRVGQTAAVDIEGLRFPSRIVEIVPAIDATSRSFIAKVDVPPGRPVRSGMFARVSFPTGTERVLAIPATALTGRADLPAVFVADSGVARLRLLTVGRSSGDRREILSGLSDGDMLIVPIPANLRDGARLEVRP